MRRFVILGTFVLPLPFAALPLLSLVFASPGHASTEAVAASRTNVSTSVQVSHVDEAGCGGPQVQAPVAMPALTPQDS